MVDSGVGGGVGSGVMGWWGRGMGVMWYWGGGWWGGGLDGQTSQLTCYGYYVQETWQYPLVYTNTCHM